ncbi:DUF393 domain-containing protein [Neptunomonas sp. XY-337]|uniref:thiol-disulfide oxidoreductase DCC family protein n=1 Tax=Neptunomonas sp. XY-337 TaxID=2561897 RepID=UPI00145B7757|nr:DUF393 domain-containing protein [Neptunomonas sp. XY-337]
MTAATTDTHITVFFDGSCPLCKKEIDHYQRIAKPNTPITWVDISAPDTEFSELPFTFEQAMRELHILDSHGNIIKGAYSFVEIWHRLPRYRWLGKLISTTGVTPILEYGYQKFAAWRARRQCKEGVCRR